jgi:hypothetical protein
MPLGSVIPIIECLSDGIITASVAPCADVDGFPTRPVVVKAYVLDVESASYIDQLGAPFDYVKGSEFFGFALITMLVIWWWSRAVGAVLSTVKRT